MKKFQIEPNIFYFTNAAKQFVWPCNHKEKLIFVPEDELPAAEADLMVKHLSGFGYHIQSEIPEGYEKTVLFSPVMRDRVVFKQPEIDDGFLTGQSFLIQSSGEILKITKRDKDQLELSYTNRYGRQPIPAKIADVTKSLRLQVWVRTA